MEVKYQNSVDDFRVKYTLVIPDREVSGYQLSDEEIRFLQDLDEAYEEIERLTNKADGYDYALAVSSGIVAGIIDSVVVGEWNFKNAKKEANKEINKKIIAFVKKDPRYIPWCEGVGKSAKWKKRDPERLASAVEFLEEKYPLPGDDAWNYKGSPVSAASHHLDDFCHHPTLVGMVCSILVQFSGMAKYHTATGDTLNIPVSVNDYGKFVSDKPFGKIFAGIINWFFEAAQAAKNQKGHLMSDMAGSKTAVKARHSGAGVPGTIMSTLKEISALPCFKDTAFAENLRKAYQNGIGEGAKQINLGVFNNLFDGASSKFDLRTEEAVKHELKRQALPVVINEIVVRSFYFIRRFVEQMKMKDSILDISWKELLPVNNRTIIRMMTISSGTLCLVDMGDAAIRAGLKSGGQLPVFAAQFVLRVNYVGIGRFTLAIGADLFMGAQKGRMEMAVASGEVAKTAILEKKVIVETQGVNENTDQMLLEMEDAMKELSNLKF